MSQIAEPTVSVVIPAYTMDRWTLLCRAVASARRQTLRPAEVILSIDNNRELLERARAQWTEDGDDSAAPVRVLASDFDHDERDLGAHARAHGATRRFGAGHARNVAAEHAVGEILFFLDDDAAADPDWVEKLLPIYSNPSVLAAGGAPLPDFETARPDWMPRQFDWVFGCAYLGLPTSPGPSLRLIGANMSVRASALRSVGGFQSVDFDDMDMCHRVADLGGPESVVYVPSAVVHHFVPARRVTWHYFWRRCYFVNKHKVRAFRDLGKAGNLLPEMRFVSATLTKGIGRELRSASHGDRAALRRVGAIVVGIGLAGMGNLAGRVEVMRHLPA